MAERRQTERPLGRRQISVLNALRRHGRWPGGWYWRSHSVTETVLESLVRRGLVRKDDFKGAAVYYPARREGDEG
jgi:hypothetical protein